MPSQGADGSQISGNEIHSKLLLLIEIKSILHVGGVKISMSCSPRNSKNKWT